MQGLWGLLLRGSLCDPSPGVGEVKANRAGVSPPGRPEAQLGLPTGAACAREGRREEPFPPRDGKLRLRERSLGLSIASDRNCNAKQHQADRLAPRLQFSLQGSWLRQSCQCWWLWGLSLRERPFPDPSAPSRHAKWVYKDLCGAPEKLPLSLRDLTTALPNTGDLLCLSLPILTCTSPCRVAPPAACPLLCRVSRSLEGILRSHRHRSSANPRPGLWASCRALGGGRVPAGLSAHPVCQERVSAPGLHPSLKPPAG